MVCATAMSADLIPAAVLIPLILGAERPESLLRTRTGFLDLPGDTEVLLTVRTHTVEHHRGQIAFPGGAFEKGDASLEQTALRESHEEVGITGESVEIVAELPQVPTVATRFQVHPFVGVIRRRPELVPNPNEIGQILAVPLRHLLDPRNSTVEVYEREGLRIPMKVYYFNEHRIWGATALMLQILLEKFIKS
jgi:8-oxo-dGTP pyrophosphatase MutT (NUDIX family)